MLLLRTVKCGYEAFMLKALNNFDLLTPSSQRITISTLGRKVPTCPDTES